jgi:hypothetical protein
MIDDVKCWHCSKLSVISGRLVHRPRRAAAQAQLAQNIAWSFRTAVTSRMNLLIIDMSGHQPETA